VGDRAVVAVVLHREKIILKDDLLFASIGFELKRASC